MVLELQLETKMMVGSINISEFWGWLKEIPFDVSIWLECVEGGVKMVCGLKTQDIMLELLAHVKSREWSLCAWVCNKILNPRGWNVLQVCWNTCTLLFFKVRYCGIASKEKSTLHFSLLVLDFLFYSKCERWQKSLEKTLQTWKGWETLFWDNTNRPGGLRCLWMWTARCPHGMSRTGWSTRSPLCFCWTLILEQWRRFKVVNK